MAVPSPNHPPGAGQGHAHALGIFGAHFQQAIDQTKPVGHLAPDHAHVLSGVGLGDMDGIHRPITLMGWSRRNQGCHPVLARKGCACVGTKKVSNS